jgi:ATP-dependent DNA helicase RecG
MAFAESENLELKSSFGEWKEIIISLSAFANKKGGTVIVGLSDSAEPLGNTFGKNSIEDFLNKLKANSDPVLYPSVVVKTFGTGEIVEISIPESDNKPVFAFDKAYIRVGRTNQKLSNQEVKELIKRYDLPDFDEHLIKLSGSFPMDYQLIESQQSQSILSKYYSGQQISNAAYLCFTKENIALPNAIVKAARFKGNDMSVFIANHDFKGSLLGIPDSIIEFIKRNINYRFIISGKAKHEEQWEYPIVALREAVLNALVHRDYSDPGNIQIRIFDSRIEI